MFSVFNEIPIWIVRTSEGFGSAPRNRLQGFIFSHQFIGALFVTSCLPLPAAVQSGFHCRAYKHLCPYSLVINVTPLINYLKEHRACLVAEQEVSRGNSFLATQNQGNRYIFIRTV